MNRKESFGFLSRKLTSPLSLGLFEDRISLLCKSCSSGGSNKPRAAGSQDLSVLRRSNRRDYDTCDRRVHCSLVPQSDGRGQSRFKLTTREKRQETPPPCSLSVASTEISKSYEEKTYSVTASCYLGNTPTRCFLQSRKTQLWLLLFLKKI